MEDNFLTLARFFNKGTMQLPADGGGEDALLEQFYILKKRYLEEFRAHYQGESLPSWRLVNSDGTSTVNLQAVIETFLDPRRPDLYKGIPGIMEMLEVVVVSSRSQSDTERSVKVVKQVMKGRYRGKHDEQKAVGSGDASPC